MNFLSPQVSKDFSATYLSKDKMIHLIKRYRYAKKQVYKDKLRDEIVSNNYKLIYSYASLYSRRTKRDINDLFSIGTEGLLASIEKFNISTGYAFSTLASRYIKGYILSYLGRDNLIDLKGFFYKPKVNKITKYNKALESFDYNSSKISLENHLRKNHINKRYQDKIENALSFIQPDSLGSLDFVGIEGVAFAETIEDKKNISPLIRLEQKELKEKILNAMDELTENEKKFVIFKYWRNMERKEIARRINKSLTWVDRLEENSYKKIFRRLKNDKDSVRSL